jgi:hypothetical protein
MKRALLIFVLAFFIASTVTLSVRYHIRVSQLQAEIAHKPAQVQSVNGPWTAPSTAVITTIPADLDMQGAKTMWWICTPAGWQGFNTPLPVEIYPTFPFSLKNLSDDPYLYGPFSPSMTFTKTAQHGWGYYPTRPCKNYGSEKG